MYKTGYVPKEYSISIYEIIRKMMKKYGISGNYSTLIKKRMEEVKAKEYKQMSFFD